MRAYLTEAITGQQVTGAEAELRKEVFAGSDSYGMMPLEMLLPPVTEARVDAATTAPTDIQGNMQSVAARVFARGVSCIPGSEHADRARWGNFVPDLVRWPHARNDSSRYRKRDATAATFATVTAEPKRLTGRYLVRIEDMAKFAQLEQCHCGMISDLAMTNSMDSIR